MKILEILSGIGLAVVVLIVFFLRLPGICEFCSADYYVLAILIIALIFIAQSIFLILSIVLAFVSKKLPITQRILSVAIILTSSIVTILGLAVINMNRPDISPEPMPNINSSPVGYPIYDI